MGRTVAIIGALDTKGPEFAFLKAQVEKRGCRTLVINVGVLGTPDFQPDISAEEVALAGGAPLAELVAAHDRGQAMEVMSRGATRIVKQLYQEARFDGIISMGGGGGTSVAATAMCVLPVGVPKLLVSTMASGDTSQYVGTSDLTLMPSIVDVAGLNRI